MRSSILWKLWDTTNTVTTYSIFNCSCGLSRLPCGTVTATVASRDAPSNNTQATYLNPQSRVEIDVVRYYPTHRHLIGMHHTFMNPFDYTNKVRRRQKVRLHRTRCLFLAYFTQLSEGTLFAYYIFQSCHYITVDYKTSVVVNNRCPGVFSLHFDFPFYFLRSSNPLHNEQHIARQYLAFDESDT